MAVPFNLKEITLLDSPFKDAMTLNARWLLELQPDRLLYRYRVSAGITPKDSSYTGWEERFSGHTLGHYMSACAMMYAATGDDIFEKRLDYIIDELEICQDASGNGYVGGVRNGREIFGRIKKGDIDLQYNGFLLNGGRVPWYNMHKLFAGLIDAYNHTGNEKAKKILINLSDWACDLVSGLPEEKLQDMLQSEHGGINESFASVYALTGDVKYLDLAKRFNHKIILDPLSESRDELDGQHANSQIPKVIGVLRQFEFGSDSGCFKIADFFWNIIVNHHSYVIGGNAESEYLGPPDHLHDLITDFTCENCGTYNMLKLTKSLFCLNPSIEKADFYERALYNQILASQNPENGTVTYFSGLAAGSSRNYCSPDKSFWCCTGTGFENHAKYGEAIYFKDINGGLFINLFIPSELNWTEKGLKLAQETKFPFSGEMTFKFNLKHPVKMSIKLRHPAWAAGDIEIEINGKKQQVSSAPGSYIELNRKWNDGDAIKYNLPMSLTTETIPDKNSVFACLYGPIVLAADLGQGINDKSFPVIIKEELDIENIISVIDREKLVFNMNAYPEDVKLLPYFATGEHTTAVYFNHISPAEWENVKRSFTETRFVPDKLKELATDQINLSNIEQNTEKEENGRFTLNMKVSNIVPMALVCTFYRDPAGENSFDILIDEEFLTHVNMQQWENRLIKKYFNIPVDYTLGKNLVTVTFSSTDGRMNVPVTECMTIRQSTEYFY